MNKSTRYIILFGIIAVLVALFVWYQAAPGKFDKFADCLKDSGVKFYGAFWCPHCQATKKEFGKSAKRLTYIECSNPDGQTQKQICTDANITGYPTWEFPNAIVISGTDADTSVACTDPYTSDQPTSCQGAAEGSWVTVINGRQFLSPRQPIKAKGDWTLPPLSRTNGEVPLELLGALSSCPLK